MEVEMEAKEKEQEEKQMRVHLMKITGKAPSVFDALSILTHLEGKTPVNLVDLSYFVEYSQN